MAVLQARGILVDGAAQGTGEELVFRARFDQTRAGLAAELLGCLEAVMGKVREGIVDAVRLQIVTHRRQPGRIPEAFQESLRVLLHAPVGDALGYDEIPGDHRHRQQDDEQEMREAVGLGNEVGKTQLSGGEGGFHGLTPEGELNRHDDPCGHRFSALTGRLEFPAGLNGFAG